MSFQPKFASVAAWAAAVGSKAKTPAGQRKAILASFRAPTPGYGYIDYGPSTRAGYLARRLRLRQGRFASTHPLVLTSPDPATPENCGLLSFRPPVSLREMLAQPGRPDAALVGGWYVSCHEEAHDDLRYSKSYRERYGNTRVVDSRVVWIRRPSDASGALETRDVAVSAWRGNYLLDALVASGILPGDKTLMPVRLHPAYALSLLRSARALKIYERTLAGEHVDYVAVRRNITFHADSPHAAVAGLRGKLRAHINAKNAEITFDLCRSLGFCPAGIRAFCRAVGLDPGERYAPAQIAEAVRANLSAGAPYATELRALAAAVGYTIPQ